MDTLQFWQLLAGLGFFLYGMLQIEQALKGFASETFTDFLQNQTKSPWRGVLGGAVATAFLQSSSVVGLMVLAFVGAGILQMRNALGIIYGANIGTTLTAWLVTMIGFKLDLDSIALPMLAIGSLGIVFLKPNSRPMLWSLLLFGFGLLIFGLGYMKDSVEALASAEHFSFRGYPPAAFVIGGLVLTAIIQSSSATTMIAISALHGGIIDLPSAAAFTIGANVGSTFTLLIGAIGGGADKKRVALAHLLFNSVTAVLVFAIMQPLLVLIRALLFTDDPLYLLSMFHTLFNIIGVMLFLPVTGRFADWLNRLFRQPEKRACAFVSNVPGNISKDVMDAIMVTAQKETHRLMLKVLMLEARTFKIEESAVVTRQERLDYRIGDGAQRLTYEECYSELKEIEGELMTFIYTVQNNTSFPEQSEHLSLLHHGIHMMVYAAKTIKDIRVNLADLRHERNAPEAFRQLHLELHIRTFCRSFIALSQIDNDSAYREELNHLEALIQHDYEHLKDSLIVTARNSSMSDIQLSTLLHINKSIHFAHKALLEAAAVRL